MTQVELNAEHRWMVDFVESRLAVRGERLRIGDGHGPCYGE